MDTKSTYSMEQEDVTYHISSEIDIDSKMKTLCGESLKIIDKWIGRAQYRNIFPMRHPLKSVFVFEFYKVIVALGIIMNEISEQTLHHKDKSCACKTWVQQNYKLGWILNDIIDDEVTRPYTFDTETCWYNQVKDKLSQWKFYFERLCKGIHKRSRRAAKRKL
jgi:hypothetical protein